MIGTFSCDWLNQELSLLALKLKETILEHPVRDAKIFKSPSQYLQIHGLDPSDIGLAGVVGGPLHSISVTCGPHGAIGVIIIKHAL